MASSFENFSPSNCTQDEAENSETLACTKSNRDLFVQDCQQIKDLLSEISDSPVAEVKPALKFACETDTESIVTEPNDSPFRVRRVSRSFSISHAPITDNELFCSDSCDEEVTSAAPANSKKSRFLILRRSRSLGNIFTNQFGIPKVKTFSQEPEVTEQVEALEVEVLPKGDTSVQDLASEFSQRVSISALIDDNSLVEKRDSASPIRPQTSPPALLNTPPQIDESDSTGKTSILDRMQKSLGFLFRCARRGSGDSHDTFGLKKTTPTSSLNMTPKPPRSLNRAIELPNSKFASVSVRAEPLAPSLPTNPIQLSTPNDASSFVTKVDSQPSHRLPIRSLPAFHDVSGPKGPLLPPPLLFDNGKKCLVLDLDETLVHSSFHIPEAYDLIVPLSLPDGGVQNIYVAKRPGVDEFLAQVGNIFEVVIFTASLSRYADPVVDFLTEGMNNISQTAVIRHRLYRESCLYLQGLYVKDLSRLGRDLSQVVIVDNSPASFLLQPDNGIPIKSWFSDTTDCELQYLLTSLNLLASSSDVNSWKSLQ